MIKKIVLNSCFGGYNWSNKAIIDYLNAVGKPFRLVRFVCYEKDEKGDDDFEKRIYADISLKTFIAQDNPTDKTYVYGCYALVNGEEFTGRRIGREDPVAIKLLEEKGSEYCSSKKSNLEIVEYDDEMWIPSISEYDGAENLELIPKISEKRIRDCKNVDEIVDLLKALCLFTE